MDDDALPADQRGALTGLLLTTVAAVAALTLDPIGSGWAWGAPADELRWYLTGLGTGATLLQLLGNLALLALPAALAVLRWPALGHPARLGGVALAAGTTIELLQWALPLGRVVSPVDAVLNATGAVAVGLLVTRARAGCPAACLGMCAPRSRPFPDSSAPTQTGIRRWLGTGLGQLRS